MNKRKREGFVFRPDVYFVANLFDGRNCGCAVGATLNRSADYSDFDRPEDDLAKTIGATPEQVIAVEAGFCAWSGATTSVKHAIELHPDLYVFGKALAVKFLKPQT